ncbi:MAG: hypothetical protein LPH21_15965 [Shewanella sp.]|nr:hypothetical protein [Shewanella sp.]
MSIESAIRRFPDDQKFLIRQQIQARYSLTTRKTRMLINQDTFPKPKTICGTQLWKLEDLEQWETECL